MQVQDLSGAGGVKYHGRAAGEGVSNQLMAKECYVGGYYSKFPTFEPSNCDISKMRACPYMPAVVLYYCTFHDIIL